MLLLWGKRLLNRYFSFDLEMKIILQPDSIEENLCRSSICGDDTSIVQGEVAESAMQCNAMQTQTFSLFGLRAECIECRLV